MKPSAVRKSRLIQPKKPEPVSPVQKTAPQVVDPKYPMRVAVVVVVCHLIFALIISAWHLHPYILNPNGFGYLIYILELPAALLIKLLGDIEDINIVLLYVGAFLINTVFYGFLGYLFGYIAQTYEWNKEINRLPQLEAEVYEEDMRR
ncbi:MAG: hypothetical protein QME51_01990 [Planctomycetota bacterium]|nr:hypothetical protein [Planctomycetota bacterium]MDI6787123.1 hypothetical protein [Planctomycetota bacterium]